MRQSFIFKAFFLLFFISNSQSFFAQSATQTNCETRSSTNVEINMSKNQKLSMKDNDDRFNMSLRFKKEHTSNVSEMLAEELGSGNFTRGNKQVWASKNEAYTFDLKEGHLYINIIKDKLEVSEHEALENVGRAALKLVGFNVDVEGSDGNFNIHID